MGFVLIGLTVTVVGVPAGLPLALSAAVVHSMRRMLHARNFAKRKSSCEKLGQITAICTEMRGILTKNEMTVTNIWQGRDVRRGTS